MKRVSLSMAVVAVLCAAVRQVGADVGVVEVAGPAGTGTGGGLNNTIYATFAPGDSTHLYVVERVNGAATNLSSITQLGQGGSNTTTTLTQGNAEIKVIDLSKPYNPAAPAANVSSFLTISGVTPTAGFSNGGNTHVNTTKEMGLLGLAFDPGYNTPGSAGYGKFYVNVSGFSGNTTSFGNVGPSTNLPVSHSMYGTQNIVQYHADPTLANPVAASTPDGTLLTWEAPFSAQHVAGWIGFSPRAGDDHNLYITTGDGSLYPAGNDAYYQAQDTSSLLGKILRIHVDPATASYGSAGNTVVANAAIAGNTPTAAPQVFAYGLRNPFRGSFDMKTGNFFMGDVGQDGREEINVQPVTSPTGGQNYGWSMREGTRTTQALTTAEWNATPYYGSGSPLNMAKAGPGVNTTVAANGVGLTGPIVDYGRSPTDTADLASALGQDVAGACVIGGYVYYGNAIPELYGKYIFAELIGNPGVDGGKLQFWAATLNGDQTAATALQDLTPMINPGTSSFNQRFKGVVSFAQDGQGNIYIIDQAIQGNAAQSNGAGSVWMLAAVPEPGSLGVLGMGVLALWRRRRGCRLGRGHGVLFRKNTKSH